MVLQFGHAGAIAKLVASPDGRELVSVGLDHTARVWDISTGELLRNMPEGRGETFRTAFFQQPDQPAVAGFAGRQVRMRDLASGEAVTAWLAQAGTDVDFSDVALSADHSTIALRVGSLGAPVVVYSAKTGAVLRSLETPGIIGGTCVSLNADGSLLAHAGYSTATQTDITAVWDVKSGRKLFDAPINNGSAHSAIAACGQFTADNSFVMAGRDGAVRFWNGRTDQLRRTFESTAGRPEAGVMNSCSHPCDSAFAISSDGNWLATGTDDGTLVVRNAATGQEVRRVKDVKGSIYAVEIGPDGKWVAYGGDDYDIRILDTATGRSRVLSTNPDLVQAVACSVAASSCAFATLDRRIRLWNLTTGRERILSGHTSQVNAVAFSPDGHWLVSGSGDKLAKVWDTASGVAARNLA